jgi:hypothetical protein
MWLSSTMSDAQRSSLRAAPLARRPLNQRLQSCHSLAQLYPVLYGGLMDGLIVNLVYL